MCCLAKGLLERDHEGSNFAEMGVKQYKYTASKKKRQVVKDQALMLKEEVQEVEQQDFAAMRNALNSNSGSAQKMITSGKNKGVENPGQEVASESKEAQLKVDWPQAYKHQQKKLKSSMSAIGSELHTADVLAAKADGLPGGNELKAIALKQLKDLKARIEAEKAEFLAEYRAFLKEVQEDEAEEQTGKLQLLSEKIHSKLQGWRKELSVQKEMLERIAGELTCQSLALQPRSCLLAKPWDKTGGLLAKPYKGRSGEEIPGTHCALMLERWQQQTTFPGVSRVG